MEGEMEQVRRRVVRHDAPAPNSVNSGRHLLPIGDGALDHPATMHDDAAIRTLCIAHLTSRLRIEGSPVEHDLYLVSHRRGRDEPAFGDEPLDTSLGLHLAVAREHSRFK